MGRARSFHTTNALDGILRQFWVNGYHATSVDDICAGSKLSKSSLYAAFGDKQTLLALAIDRYIDTRVAYIRSLIEGAPSFRSGIASLLKDIIDDATAGTERPGCFLGNCAIEIGSADREVAARVRKGLAEMENIFASGLERARSQGEISKGAAVRSLARFLVAGFQGLRLVGKVAPEREILEDIASTLVGCVDWKRAPGRQAASGTKSKKFKGRMPCGEKSARRSRR